MLSKKTLLCLGMLLSGSLNFVPPGLNKKLQSPQDCDEQDMKKILELLDDDNPLCAKWDDDVCIKCANKSYFNQKGKCIQIDPLCQNFDDRAAKCISCYPGYDLENGKCIQQSKIKGKQVNWTFNNPLCANWKNKKCIRCSNKSYFNSQGICIMVSPDCRTHSDSTGKCISCYDGYKLQNDGRCIKSQDDLLIINNPLCSKWDKQGNCLVCATKSFKNSQGICVQIDPYCQSYQNQNGNCLTCYGGYIVQKGKCVVENMQYTKLNPYCTAWINRQCTKCSNRTFMNNEKLCTPINPLCKTYSLKTGNCQSCYPGYKLAEGKCPEQNSGLDIQSNPLCSEWQRNKCSKCSARSYMNQDGICVGVDPNCSTYNQKTGDCKTCYSGYQVEKGRCVVGQVETSSVQLQQNKLCGQWKDRKCIRCSQRSYFNQNGICIQIDPYCQKFSEEKKICMKCYSGYKLKKDLKGCISPNMLVIQPTVVQIPTNTLSSQTQTSSSVGYNDPLCSSWQNPYKCKKCAPGSYFNESKICKAHDSNCKSFNQQNLVCQQCYGQYLPISDKCIKLQVPANQDISKCLLWKERKCQKCATGLKLNDQGLCVCKQEQN